MMRANLTGNQDAVLATQQRPAVTSQRPAATARTLLEYLMEPLGLFVQRALREA